MSFQELKTNVQNWWYLKDSKTRTAYTKYASVALIISGLLWMYYGSKGAEQAPVESQANDTNTVELPPKDSLDADIRENVATQIEASKAETKAMIAEALRGIEASPPNGFPGTPVSTPAPDSKASEPAQNEEADLGQTNGEAQPFSYPDPPASTPVDGGQAPGEQGPRFSYIGGISNDGLPSNNDGIVEGPAGKKSKSLIQLPVGFMRARLLVGVNALVGEFAQENPQTLMFRVQAPAQLPNSIKMNLRGCFTIANVHGNLSAERIFVLPVSMHCMTMDGKTIVEGQIKGFVSDKDGKRDMAAHVVSRAGSLLASAVFAKTVEGFANVAAQDGYETNTSALGSVQTLKSDEMAKTAVTKGVSGGVSELGTYLLDLAKQTSPVLETGPGKEVTLFVQETAELEIKEVRIQ
ncbi:conjugal transfer protein TraB [Aeromonas hydrophila]|uniref:TraB/VirB10 family protein n=1 Tax=Aeromonas hydrophila TaxID=644 RepID=UPI001C5BEFE4|nr:TraB/VirB10 family protein [Aeromonas hydrophila]MBW3798972.1 conjugal transfer protein TraB [Aeromonas hydrophila]MBW3803765.1 conjugal transfer protein TraB [Aeromonas hydrophila]MBW3821772.1 conjugal transfer protein TraB [Aeromonas hydrophila]